MISVTKLLFARDYFGDRLRYTKNAHTMRNGAAEGVGPVVVWNSTKTCNLKCMHCYMQSDAKKYKDELTTEEAKKFIDDLADFHVPVLLFSGGEPLIRPDFFELAAYAQEKGVRPTLSTNGTLITREVAQRIKDIGVGYVGISLDGLKDVNDKFRGVDGAYEKAMQGIKNCVAVGQRVGLRFTINHHNIQELDRIFDFIEAENINRVCFYHLVYSGRGTTLVNEDLTHEQSRACVDLIMDETRKCFEDGKPKEILTVDNHADGPYLWMRLKREDPKRAEEVFHLLQYNEGNNSGRGIGCISWDGKVSADQFWRQHVFGNVLERPFSEIWDDPNIELLHKMKNKKLYVKGRCHQCQFLNICGGNFRARAEAVYGDEWAPDPACYLTDEEIGIK